MKSLPLNLIIIGHATAALQGDGEERRRLQSYAAEVGTCHVIVLTRAEAGAVRHVQIGNLELHGAAARTRLGRFLLAVRIGRRLIRQAAGEWVVASADPFLAGVVGRAVARGDRSRHVLELSSEHFATRLHPFSPYIRRRWVSYLVHRVECVQVDSHHLARTLVEQGVDRERIHVVPPTANLEPCLQVGRARTFGGGGALRFLWLGRSGAEEEAAFLIAAFAAVWAQYPDARLTLVAEASDQAVLESLSTKHSVSTAVQIRTKSDDVVGLLATHDVFCATPPEEGWAMELVQAAAAGLAIITTNAGCATELIEHGAHGQVLPRGDRERYTAAMLDYLVNPSHIATHAQNAYALAERFVVSEAEQVRRVVDVYASSTEKNIAILRG